MGQNIYEISDKISNDMMVIQQKLETNIWKKLCVVKQINFPSHSSKSIKLILSPAAILYLKKSYPAHPPILSLVLNSNLTIYRKPLVRFLLQNYKLSYADIGTFSRKFDQLGSISNPKKITSIFTSGDIYYLLS